MGCGKLDYDFNQQPGAASTGRHFYSPEKP